MKLFAKIILYGILVFIVLEILVRIFHLQNDLPTRSITEKGIYHWTPGQEGYTVYGNRRQNYAKYHINESGYNSYREFNPTEENFEIALVGDSFIEGFHQNYFNSIGKKIEKKIEGIKVYEYGHSSNDLADQLHLIQVNKQKFKLIDHIIIGLKYENDLTRPEYKFIKRKPYFPILRNSKLVVYLLNIGFLDPIKTLNIKIRNLRKDTKQEQAHAPLVNKDSLYLDNFKKLINLYEFDKKKMTFLFDSRATNSIFLHYLKTHKISYIDYANSFEKTEKPTTLIYDKHWNDYGRTLIAEEVVNYLNLTNISK